MFIEKPPKVIAIVLARLDSKRLPGKALRMVNGKPLISYCIERIKMLQELSAVVLATTDRPVDDALADYAKEQNVQLFRGESDNVAMRCLDCARQYEADYFLRVNGDSPFVDHDLAREGLKKLSSGHPDLVTNLINRTYPYGVSVELVKVLKLASTVNKMNKSQAEHVTKFYYDNSKLFSIYELPRLIQNYSNIRMVVDDEEDRLIFTHVVSILGEQVLTSGYEKIASTYKRILSIS